MMLHAAAGEPGLSLLFIAYGASIMTSLLTNVASIAALSTLRSISSQLDATQAKISSGLRVETASDNAAYWSIATTMRSDNDSLAAVHDALGLGSAKVDAAYAGMEAAVDVVKEIKAKLVTATEDGVDRTKIQDEISQLQDQLVGIADAASFSGQNWLKADISAAGGSLDRTVAGAFVRAAGGNVSITRIAYRLDATSVLFDEGGDTGILDSTTTISGPSVSLDLNVAGVTASHSVAAFTTDQVIAAGGGTTAFDGRYGFDGTDSYVKVADDIWVRAVDQTTVAGQEVAFKDSSGNLWAVDLTSVTASQTASVVTFSIGNTTTADQLDGLVRMVDDALALMTDAGSNLGSISMRLDLQEAFVSKLTDSIDSGVGKLVDADMNEESTRLKALQTQRQLAIQALSIANSNPESLLTLFR